MIKLERRTDPACRRVLIYGIGNPGRQDDGLGPALVEAVQGGGPWDDKEILFDANYQLNIEDAETISHFNTVIFADAWHGNGNPPATGYQLWDVEPEPTASFSTHSVSPGGIIALCNEMYNAFPDVYMLAICGYEWDVNAPLSERARTNLNQAVSFVSDALRSSGAHSLLG